MSDENQIVVPPSFIALFMPPGRIKPTEPREFIAQRHEYCEDMASLLTETAQTQLWSLGITEADVLERVRRGLADPAVELSAAEAGWVLSRLAEILEWDPLVQPDPPESVADGAG